MTVDAVSPGAGRVTASVSPSAIRGQVAADAVPAVDAGREHVSDSMRVAISREGRLKSRESELKEHSTAASVTDWYAIPVWYADYLPESVPVGTSALEMDRINARFNVLSEGEQQQYFPALSRHLLQMMSDFGIQDGKPAFDAFIADPVSSAFFRQEYERRLAADPVMMKLLAKIGMAPNPYAHRIQGEKS
ncbi:hypothetical protein [Herbaspirillum huttiense]|uniref:Uncharacterized protein n=2 Tax=Herbaspirillum huttiense TaxID=863372 RepID=A0AAJ2H7Z3_9BURK|nr:hypothetical protein [Herbaspirillum huttiense]MDR9837233.1 hypothetical protein [Herbaspirillum huttiense]